MLRATGRNPPVLRYRSWRPRAGFSAIFRQHIAATLKLSGSALTFNLRHPQLTENPALPINYSIKRDQLNTARQACNLPLHSPRAISRALILLEKLAGEGIRTGRYVTEFVSFFNFIEY